MTASNRALAERVVQRLLAEGMITPSVATGLQLKILDGEIKQADWHSAMAAVTPESGLAPAQFPRLFEDR